ncbi:MAG: DUF1631 domain-containing protein, partial [Gammaproteobacteria bacterium]|nr:DUF1631 domain-containing protein [Gammaproteobacteria bacterium]
MKGVKSVSVLSSAGSPLPGLMQSIAEFAAQRLRAALGKMFDELDDQFFELAEESQSNADQNLYFEAMRDIRIGRRGVEQAFKQNILNDFRRMCCSLTETEIPTLQFSCSDAELESTLERISRKCQAIASVDLYQLITRFDEISSGFHVTEKNNALSPRLICEAFNKATQGLNIDIKIKLLVLKLFDRFVLHTLPQLLNDSNQVLVEAGVLPELSKQLKNAANEEVKPATVDEHDIEEKAFTQLQQLIDSEGVFENGGVGACKVPVSTVSANITLLNQGELISLLSSLQRQISLPDEKVPLYANLDLPALVMSLLNERRDQFSGSQLAKEDKDKLYLVQKLFSAIFDDSTLPDLVKAAISRLQIPLVKIAVLDATLFDEKEHVARALINALAAMGLECGTLSSMAQEITYARIEEVVQRIVREFDDDQCVFEREYNEISLFNMRDKRKLQQEDERTELASTGREKAELARVVVTRVLAKIMKGNDIPKVLSELFVEGWSNLLLITLLKEGVESEAWSDYILTAEEIIWSVQSEKDGAARQRLLTLVPGLIVRLREGLTKISYNAYEMSLIFLGLEQAHLAALGMQSRSVSPVASLAVSGSATTGSQPNKISGESGFQGGIKKGGVADITRQIVEKSQCRGTPFGIDKSISEDDSASNSELKPASSKKPRIDKLSNSQAEEIVDSLNLGTWFVVNRENGGKYRCKLAAYLSAYDKYIFVN